MVITSTFKHYGALLFLPLEVAFPGRWAVLPPSVHAVQRAKHAINFVYGLVELDGWKVLHSPQLL